MRGIIALAMAAAVLTTAAACSSGSDRTPGAVSADEADQLNDAAAMLDANSFDTNVAGEPAAVPANESDPE